MSQSQNVKLVAIKTVHGKSIWFPGTEFECSQAESERLVAKGVARVVNEEGARPLKAKADEDVAPKPPKVKTDEESASKPFKAKAADEESAVTKSKEKK